MNQSPSGLELVSELSHLAASVAILNLALTPFALPALALAVFFAAALLIPALFGLVLAAMFFFAACERS